MSLFDDLMDFNFDLTCKALDIDPATQPQNILPLSYPDSPAGLKNPHADCVFYLVQFDDAGINRQIDDITAPNADETLVTRKIQYVRNLRFIWQLYGDDGAEWGDTLRIMLFDPDIQTLLAKQGISLITDVPDPVGPIPEKIGQQWYKRYDLYAKFNQLVTKETTLPAVASADVVIVTEKGVET